MKGLCRGRHCLNCGVAGPLGDRARSLCGHPQRFPLLSDQLVVDPNGLWLTL
jgi:hypothetical protein